MPLVHETPFTGEAGPRDPDHGDAVKQCLTYGLASSPRARFLLAVPQGDHEIALLEQRAASRLVGIGGPFRFPRAVELEHGVCFLKQASIAVHRGWIDKVLRVFVARKRQDRM